MPSNLQMEQVNLISYFIICNNFVFLGVCHLCNLSLPNCLECNWNNANCSKCKNGFHQEPDSNGTCQKCGVDNCAYCPLNEICQFCMDGYVLKNDICVACPENCDICSNSTECITCKRGFSNLTFPAASCESICQSNEYYSEESTCLTCDTKFSNCTKCTENLCSNCSNTTRFFPEGICCPIGSYLDENQSCQHCSKATDNCSDCLANTTCIECQQGLTLIENICCATGFYLDENKTCQLCSKSTKNCYNCLLNKTCIECQPGFILNAGSCGCSTGFFMDENNTCQSCSKANSNCSACLANKTCIQCQQGYTLINGICCQNGTYLDSYKTCQLCSKASANCLDCLINKTCIACKQGFILNAGSCECLSGYFMDENNTCQLCSKANSNCTACLANKTCVQFQQGYALKDGICCMNGTYLDANKTCKLCSNASAGCLDCLINKTCIGCKQGFILNSGSCECTSGYFMDENNTCQLCSKANSNCTACLANKTCVQCQQGFNLFNGTCLCPGGFFRDENQICQLCSIVTLNCLDCYTNKTCKNCQQGYLLTKDSKCLFNVTTNTTIINNTNTTTNANNTTNASNITSESKPKAQIKNITIENFKPSIIFECSTSSQIFYVYGLQNSVDNIELSQIKAKKTANAKEWELETSDEIYWIGYGGVNSGHFSFNITKKLKNSGEKYRMKLWCISDSTNKESDPIVSNWTQPDNKATPTNVTITLEGTKKATKKQKSLIGGALVKTLGLNNNVYTDDGIKVSNPKTNRVLQSTNQYDLSFYVMPDYSAIVDNTSSLIAEKISDSTSFITDLKASIVDLNTGEDLGLSVAGITYSILSNDFDQTQPKLLNEFPNITESYRSLRVDLGLSQDGTIYLVVIPFNSSNSSMSSNKSANLISYSELIAFSNIKSVDVSENVSSTIIIRDLSKGSSYIAYYAGVNKQMPALYTDVYSQMVKTKGNNKIIFSLGLLLISILFLIFF